MTTPAEFAGQATVVTIIAVVGIRLALNAFRSGGRRGQTNVSDESGPFADLYRAATPDGDSITFKSADEQGTTMTIDDEAASLDYWREYLDEECRLYIDGDSSRSRIAVAAIRRNSDGVTHVWRSTPYPAGYPASAILYQWTGGNYGCDCNREIFWKEVVGEEADERECGHDAFTLTRLHIKPADA